ncbi:staygreen family protein [Salimicrobium halophilum]|uniref:Staygreen protein n=1 Tax=Salimicrobium halophilum TaxID=86666 RepID=A0A1G8UDH0_9BACI|nr:staygreen family protein [Salimicrobium halophilum]SDJ51664.1 Staygreen protein [Salimicrobium halophilum]
MTFDPQKLSVTLVPSVTESQPIENRKYTLTHSDITGELFLTVGTEFDIAAIDPVMRDEVIAEWNKDNQNRYVLAGNVHVDGSNMTKASSMVRFNIFQREMDTALKGIIYGDRAFFAEHPYLLDAPIFIQFDSVYPEFNRILYFGTPRQYL